MNPDEIRDLIPLYVLDVLTPEEHAEVEAAIVMYECELGIPATDALTRPTERLVEMVLAAFPSLRETLAAGAP